jgi:predicted O-methyltransferase YrrM
MKNKIIFVCHSFFSVGYITSLNLSDYAIIYVGQETLSEELCSNSRIIVARNFNDNIESDKELLTFTAWYLISKNNLFLDYDYLCILEWDVVFQDTFFDKLNSFCNYTYNYDVISFFSNENNFYSDINVDTLNYFLQKINIDPNLFNCNTFWFSTTNHCIRRVLLNEFVDLYYSIAPILKILDYKNISWYHERIFSAYLLFNKMNVLLLDGLEHYQKYSHCTFKRYSLLPDSLVKLYMMNDTCEYLNKLIHNYDIFNNLFQSCNHKLCQGMSSYLFDGYNYTYSSSSYEKQKKLFEIAKKSDSVLEVGSYMSHSLFIMLLANPNIKITCIDINHIYSVPSIKVLEDKFSTKIKFINDDYKTVLPLLEEKYDLIHFDTSNNFHDIQTQFQMITTNYLNDQKNKVYFIIGQSENCNEDFKNKNNHMIEHGEVIFYVLSSKYIANMLVFEYINCNTVLKKLAYNYKTDKLNHEYISFYENYFSSFSNDVFNFLEIGVFFGSSICMWSKFFPNATIYGIDHFTGHQGNRNTFTDADKFLKEVNNSNNSEYDNIELLILDQSNENHLINFKKKSLKKNLKFKVILDDGSHLMRDQQLTFYHLFDLLEEGGIFIIEDLHSSEEKDYDVLPDKLNSTKKLFEDMLQGNVFKSFYVDNDNKCKEITEQILNINIVNTKNNSKFVIIFKK